MSERLERYLVDNNALFDLTSEQRTSPKFRDIARVPTEVIHEAGEYAHTERLDRLDYPTTASVLEHLKRVMATVEPDDRSLVDLFKYEGAADPLLVACAPDANDAPAGLLGVRWTVVTGDDAVRASATSSGSRGARPQHSAASSTGHMGNEQQVASRSHPQAGSRPCMVSTGSRAEARLRRTRRTASRHQDA